MHCSYLPYSATRFPSVMPTCVPVQKATSCKALRGWRMDTRFAESSLAVFRLLQNHSNLISSNVGLRYTFADTEIDNMPYVSFIG